MNNAESCKKWRESHKEAKRAYDKKYYEAHKEHCNGITRAWRLNNKEKIKTDRKIYAEQHKEQIKNRMKRWYQANKKRIDTKRRDYRAKHPEVMRPLYSRAKSRRRRELDFIPLNDWFGGCEAHHLDKELVLYIPEELHHSVWHDLNDSASMELINEIVINWYVEFYNLI